jgi:hypothetical protein
VSLPVKISRKTPLGEPYGRFRDFFAVIHNRYSEYSWSKVGIEEHVAIQRVRYLIRYFEIC